MSDAIAADVAAGESPAFEEAKVTNLPMRKRKKEEDVSSNGGLPPTPEAKMPNTEDDSVEDDEDVRPLKRAPMSKAREIRLEQNRKAARESRRRKKQMIEELQV